MSLRGDKELEPDPTDALAAQHRSFVGYRSTYTDPIGEGDAVSVVAHRDLSCAPLDVRAGTLCICR